MKGKTKLTLDASVLAKWFIEEADSHRAVEIRNDYIRGEVELSTSSLALFELGNIFWKHPGKTPEDVKEDFGALLALGVKMYNFTDPSLITEAFKAAREMEVTFYDASYIAVSRIEAATFVTADERLHTKVGERSQTALLSKWPVQSREPRPQRKIGG